jgi:hypothetical protein
MYLGHLVQKPRVSKLETNQEEGIWCKIANVKASTGNDI